MELNGQAGSRARLRVDQERHEATRDLPGPLSSRASVSHEWPARPPPAWPSNLGLNDGCTTQQLNARRPEQPPSPCSGYVRNRPCWHVGAGSCHQIVVSPLRPI